MASCLSQPSPIHVRHGFEVPRAARHGDLLRVERPHDIHVSALARGPLVAQRAGEGGGSGLAPEGEADRRDAQPVRSHHAHPT